MDGAAFPGALAMEKGLQYGGMRVHSCANIACRNADASRRVRCSRDGADPGFRLDQQVVCTVARKGPFLAITRDVAGDEAWVQLTHFPPPEAGALGRTGPKILNKDVRLRDHGLQQCQIVRLSEVEHHRFLASIQPNEIGAIPHDRLVVTAREIAVAPFNLYDPGAGIGKTRSGKRSGSGLLHGNDQQTLERQRHTASTWNNNTG